MQKCSICEKSLYTQNTTTPVVCTSCSLTKLGSASSKSMYQVRFELGKLATKQTEKREEFMIELKVVSNYARNRVVLLDGKYPLSFDSLGVAKCPAHLREALDREMIAKPNRYRIEAAVVPSAVAEVVIPTPEQLQVSEVVVEATPEHLQVSETAEEATPEHLQVSETAVESVEELARETVEKEELVGQEILKASKKKKK